MRGCLHEKTRAGASFTLGWLFDSVSRLHDDCFMSYLVILRYISCWWNTRVVQNRKQYACATRSSLPADRFHTEIGGRFAFTWYRCEISYQGEILTPVREPGWIHAWVTRAGITFFKTFVVSIANMFAVHYLWKTYVTKHCDKWQRTEKPRACETKLFF